MQQFNLAFIVKRRKELNLSLQYMADGLGFRNASTYLKYERGEYQLRANQLPILAKLLQCSVSDFFIKNVAKSATKAKEVC
ncbi:MULTISPECIES: helix-turn-helix domain-containing protein [Heyndrickxia]|uniref:Helix-turn-helix n=1 Tax=Heyndrickxia coagulans DSM 1 = ATCC 7050 TaxID=1121088 RepID=A0A0B5WSD1_HEYCO|nr:helix-turn-helix transcriptional regulator [Heyndrickxia coagulans]AJH77501.1 helix-turn-helix family protein [Heyndrickxia coagulans DSM 1 = ATCC 7050]AJH78619.1 helix-turn-helix family protein [Heyndrickxia coagulans DSM 1 = ATCC 7050]AWP37808.1 XRE family transcriptional regulator [Heyndrickxia coagulans]MCR2847352.1 helix-turn-helix transcriptional regulator [Heyndrickxia coagulans]MDR4225176.1 helix-turn-helix transcriptional regulator [Heyndrickxia coagulans DSM 1 = ATCC 7050]